MIKKVIAIDLDGTLLRSDNTISDYTIQTIKKIKALGHHIIITTGRPSFMSIDYYNMLELDTPMINFNGALTYIPGKKWEFEHTVRIDKKYLFEVLKCQEDFEADFIASQYRKNFFIALNNDSDVNPELFGVKKFLDHMFLIPNKITKDPNALLMQTRAEDRYALAKEIKQYFNYELEVDSWGGPFHILEFSPKGINKAYALKYLLNVLNISKEHLIAFGDEHNDIEMIDFAPTSYAMKNATSLLLPHASKQLDETNDEDGVAKQLEKLFF
ncbi:Cof-type HAD-IIB family hydrolase [Streptococcus zalophi]|uniref:HAD family phosphatase n=1 Tax=Streptococcus zalophi TaxID=640031 RepID=A0A934UD01_9STRE|nr:Cof-type HAD-IIB family hydrolase [Streptococcus zalophi]MBJ8349260.1 HAD family phosphatase [Streptococcus zalophi]MCR8967118.1 Cof-type HAD-IIB family hydrolase [Streptococcus zalophi]